MGIRDTARGTGGRSSSGGSSGPIDFGAVEDAAEAAGGAVGEGLSWLDEKLFGGGLTEAEKMARA